MGRRISFSVARLDKEAFITGPCLWAKVLQDVIYNLEVFSSWSSPPTPSPPQKKLVCAVEPVSLWQPRAVCTHSWGWPAGTVPWHCAAQIAPIGCMCNGQRGVSELLVTDLCPLAQDSALVLLSIPAAAPCHLPPLKFVEDKAWDRDLLPPLQIFNEIAAVMACIYCNVFLQINIALK